MTLPDLVCDRREDRWLTGRWRSKGDMGLQFHQNLLEEKRDKMADLIDKDPEAFRSACSAMGGRPILGADIACAMEFLTDWRSACNSGTEMMSFIPGCGICGVKMPYSI